MYIVEKILLFILIFAILIVLKEGINFFLVMREALKGENERQLNLSTKRLVILGCAISYIFTIIFTGFKLF